MEDRVMPIAEENLPEELKPIYENFKQNFGEVPLPIKVMANNPAYLKLFVQKHKVLWEENSLDPKTKVLIALVISTLNNCEFCIRNYTMQAKKLGISDKEIIEAISLIDLVGSMNHFNNGMRIKP
ncbi:MULTISPECIES: carboxymuconolactone decarboxylase family protein [Carboxydothermus]|uniref:4-carboxymuconolactone decarboxylase domain protein n=2 Tax=Carboxydothermus TaxID=129957 RepID=Q3ADS9_CARHZ|nr:MULTISPECIES: carboxymuconolactone decarboxylase family protein [Carboxydothermus]ABB13819.1 4-carboxymuconolactone decarboxylase domain protein [Carboxydothermus hydrogenoformans Z-2901]NYE56755.1 AhpD family alkylhydroperoxidase [Carboxydothermus ferrireducens DSM 11255]